MAKPRGTGGLPSRQELIDFIARSPTPVGKREIAKAFRVDAADRWALRALLGEIGRSGEVARGPRRKLARAGALPEMAVVELCGIDAEGEAPCRLIGSDADGPVIRLVKGAGAVGPGERAIVGLRPLEDGSYAAEFVRKLEPESERVLGLYAAAPGGGGTIQPTDRRNRSTYRVRPTEAAGAEDGELVLAAPLPVPRLGLPHAQVIERLGRLDDPRAISLVAIHSHGIPVGFPPKALEEAAAATPVALGDRADLRPLPLVTIDGADARDFDDAVWAEAMSDGTWHAVVAIADVAWYVRPGTALDRAAEARGNSVYFPDRVVPMLPEALSNELCSLKPGVDRACLAIHLWIDGAGDTTRHEVVRGLMRSVARLTYEAVQAAADGTGEGRAADLREPVLRPLYGVFQALLAARRERGTLDLDLPERRVVLAPDGAVLRMERRHRLGSHRLIEELMIAANVAAAETLERLRQPCMYRVHGPPDPERLDALRDVLESLGIPGLKLAKGQVVRPRHFAEVLAKAADRPEAALINDLVLRCQAQAAYAPENIGHFGLALRRYAHFTSPIRRYADLHVHRALIDGLKLGPGGLAPTTPEAFAELGAHLSRTERRAALAERTAVERSVALYMQDRVGATFDGRISGVARFGLFVTLDETGADWLVPAATLPEDRYHHDAGSHTLTGQRSGRTYTLGDPVEVRLAEADPVTGGLGFALLDGGGAARRRPSRPPSRRRRRTP